MSARRITHLVVIAFSLVATVYAIQFGVGSPSDPGPGMWPATGGALMFASSIVLAFREKSGEDYEEFPRPPLMKVLIALGIILASAVIFGLGGMVLAIAFLVLAWMIVLGREPLLTSALIALGTVVAVYLIFDVGLGIPLPSDLVLNLLGP